MIRLDLHSNRWYRSRWEDGEDPFKVIDEDSSPELAIEHIRSAADNIHQAMRLLADNDEEIVFNLRKYTNFEAYMTMENYIGLMLAILICSVYGRAHFAFRSEREMVDVLGTFISDMLDSMVGELPEWIEPIKDWGRCSEFINTWRHTTDTHAFRIAALALNLIGVGWKKADKPENDDFGLFPANSFEGVA